MKERIWSLELADRSHAVAMVFNKTALTQALNDPAWIVRCHAVTAVAELGWEATRPAIEGLALHDPHEKVRVAAATALDKLSVARRDVTASV